MDLILPRLAQLGRGEAGVERVERQGLQLGGGQPELVAHSPVVGVDVPAEVGRVVAIDGGEKAGIEHGGQWMVGERVDDVQAHVGQRAHRQRGLVVAKAGNHLGIVHRPDTMIDPLDVQAVHRLRHALGVALLASVGDEVQPLGGGAGEHVSEQRVGKADLGGVQSDPDDVIAKREHRREHLVGGVGTEVTQETHDQVRRHVVAALPVTQPGGETVDHRAQRQTVGKMGLRVEEDLGAPHIALMRPAEVGNRQLVEVLLAAQHLQVRVMQVEERLQVSERIPRPELVEIGGRKPGTVAGGQRQDHLWLQRPLDVDVQLGSRRSHTHWHRLTVDPPDIALARNRRPTSPRPSRRRRPSPSPSKTLRRGLRRPRIDVADPTSHHTEQRARTTRVSALKAAQNGITVRVREIGSPARVGGGGSHA